MKITKASLSSPKFLEKFRLMLVWKDPSRIEMTEGALDFLRRMQVDYNNPAQTAMLKLLIDFPAEDIQTTIAYREDLTENLQLLLAQTKYPSVLDKLARRHEGVFGSVQYSILDRVRREYKEAESKQSSNMYHLRNILSSLASNDKIDITLLPQLYEMPFLKDHIASNAATTPDLLDKIAYEYMTDSSYDGYKVEQLMQHSNLSLATWLKLLELVQLQGPKSYRFSEVIEKRLFKLKDIKIVAL